MSSLKELLDAVNNYYPILDGNGIIVDSKKEILTNIIEAKVNASIIGADIEWRLFVNNLQSKFKNNHISYMGGYQIPSLYLFIDLEKKALTDGITITTQCVIIKSLLLKGYTSFFEDMYEHSTYYNNRKIKSSYPRYTIRYSSPKKGNNNEMLAIIMDLLKIQFPDDIFYHHLLLNNTNMQMGPTLNKMDLNERKNVCSVYQYLFDDYFHDQVLVIE